MSHHILGAGRRAPALEVLQGGRGRGPARVYAPEFFIATLRDMGEEPKLLLVVIAGAVWRNRHFQPHLEVLAKKMQKSTRTLIRWTKALERGRYITVQRRGRGRSNRYRLTRWFWARLVAGNRGKLDRGATDALYRLGLKIGVDPATMKRRGVRPSP